MSRSLIISGTATLVLLAACAGEPGTPLEPAAGALAGAGSPAPGAPLSIAFQSSRDLNSEIYLMNPDGSNAVRLTNNNVSDVEPDLSPNGHRVAFTSSRSGNADIWVMNADGSDAVNLTSSAGADSWARWSPNGQQIAFESMRDGNWELYLMNADGSGLVRLTTYAGIDRYPAWSPEGGRLLFRRDHDVYVLDLADGSATRLTTDPALDQMAAWSQNGRRIAFMSLRDGYCSVFLMNADGSDQTNLTPKDPADASSAWCSRAPSWTRNGRILFMSFRPSTGGDVEVFVMDADGSALERLTTSPGEDGIPMTR
jgi:Tol biopolymer transport system component